MRNFFRGTADVRRFGREVVSREWDREWNSGESGFGRTDADMQWPN